MNLRSILNKRKFVPIIFWLDKTDYSHMGLNFKVRHIRLGKLFRYMLATKIKRALKKSNNIHNTTIIIMIIIRTGGN